MVGIADMFGSRLDRVENFEKQAEGLSKEDTRALEVQMLKPEPMQSTSCPPATSKGITDTKIALYIPPRRYWRIFKKFFKVSRMGERNNGDGQSKGENSVRDIDIFLALLDSLITQKLVYNSETKVLETGLSLRVQDAIAALKNDLTKAVEADDMGAPGVVPSIVQDVFHFLDILEGKHEKSEPRRRPR